MHKLVYFMWRTESLTAYEPAVIMTERAARSSDFAPVDGPSFLLSEHRQRTPTW
jgi:hypothetical protein